MVTFDRSMNFDFLAGDPPELSPLRLEEEVDIRKIKLKEREVCYKIVKVNNQHNILTNI